MDEEKITRVIDYKITEFAPKYTDAVIDLIDKELRSLGAIPTDSERVNDSDLFKIPGFYSGKSKFWIAVDNTDKLIGTVAIKDMGEGTAKLNRMFVEGSLHGKGIGQALFNTALAFVKDNGYREIILNTHITMGRAHHFYEKNGFVKEALNEDKYAYKLTLN